MSYVIFSYSIKYIDDVRTGIVGFLFDGVCFRELQGYIHYFYILRQHVQALTNAEHGDLHTSNPCFIYSVYGLLLLLQSVVCCVNGLGDFCVGA